MDYNYAKGTAITPGKVIQNFTAQVWKSVRNVGYGFCTANMTHLFSPSKSLNLTVMYVVANFSPTPNRPGYYRINVLRPT